MGKKPNKAFIANVSFKVVDIPVKAKNKREARQKVTERLKKFDAARYLDTMDIDKDWRV